MAWGGGADDAGQNSIFGRGVGNQILDALKGATSRHGGSSTAVRSRKMQPNQEKKSIRPDLFHLFNPFCRAATSTSVTPSLIPVLSFNSEHKWIHHSIAIEQIFEKSFKIDAIRPSVGTENHEKQMIPADGACCRLRWIFFFDERFFGSWNGR